MEWEEKLAQADEALAQLGHSDDEIESICRRAANGAMSFAEIDQQLEELADGSIELAPLPAFDLDAVASHVEAAAPDVDVALRDDWEEDAVTVYAPAAGADEAAYADLAEGTASPAQEPNTDWDDIHEEATMAAEIVETEDGEFVLMVDEDDIEFVEEPDDSGVEVKANAKEADAKGKGKAKADDDDDDDKSFLRRLFSRS